MNKKKISSIVNIFIAIVWLVNGLVCKLLNFTPRHEEIVGNIISSSHSRIWIILIGIAEVIMATWILSGYKKRINALTQIIVIASMNVLEFMLVPNLLLWGKLNAFFAFLFIVIIYVNEFHWRPKTT